MMEPRLPVTMMANGDLRTISTTMFMTSMTLSARTGTPRALSLPRLRTVTPSFPMLKSTREASATEVNMTRKSEAMSARTMIPLACEPTRSVKLFTKKYRGSNCSDRVFDRIPILGREGGANLNSQGGPGHNIQPDQRLVHSRPAFQFPREIKWCPPAVEERKNNEYGERDHEDARRHVHKSHRDPHTDDIDRVEKHDNSEPNGERKRDTDRAKLHLPRLLGKPLCLDQSARYRTIGGQVGSPRKPIADPRKRCDPRCPALPCLRCIVCDPAR